MSDPTHTAPATPGSAPEDEPRAHDPVAVALGNASLLGVGYLIARRPGLAVVALAVTITLVSRLVSTADVSYEIAVLVWWAAVVAHGWFLARGGGGRGARHGLRLAALAVTLPVLLAVGLLRYDAAAVGRSVTEARERGDCAGVLSAQDEVWFGHRVADAPLTARGDDVVRACDRLRSARTELTTALGGDTEALEDGFGTLASVLSEPGNGKAVEATLSGFLDRLETKNPCGTVAVVDWLQDRVPSHDVLDRSAGAAERVAPDALAGCGDALMEDSSFENARSQYQRLLDRYPDDDLADKARSGVRKATQNIELAHVRFLLAPGTGGRPEYCSDPAKYSGAKAFGKGTNRALFYAYDQYADDYSEQLPGAWRADGPTDAVLVVCMGEDTFGSAVRTCPYQGTSSGSTSNVTFYKIELPVKVYELRTGKLVMNRKIQIDGASCPGSITYYSSGDHDPGPPSTRYVEESKSDVKDAFRSLVVR
ncbi:tol-pal system YbgF family protein [Streptomyces sp. NPDC056464]|uniref:tetratricopeptide repeat protein n=1 Tax=Streptomyces sp. NPDC056464 TaxID=3345828 RepID=UPI0036B77840